MQYAKVIVLVLLSWLGSYAQTYEIGAFVGGSNLIGDVGSTTYINPNSLAGGLLFKWNRSPRHSFRFSLIRTNLTADDANADDNRRNERGYAIDNMLTEASLGLEFNFWEFDLHKSGTQFTPYLYSGVSYFMASTYQVENEVLVEGSTDRNFAIPMVFGVKGRIFNHVVLGAEIGARYTFTDGLDGSDTSATTMNDIPLSFGNPNTKDWFMFTGITLTYTFGRKPCNCVF
ncbi:DUF6089 family protein [Gangjinia marincola]|uniref:DUF6089 family protein n=1 Tax=Gangjinia marincola TaxID=578463 RepID=A0ABP3XQ59_9FLAO